MFSGLHFTWGTGNWIALGFVIVAGIAWLILALRRSGGTNNRR